jgi:hypothetical protein
LCRDDISGSGTGGLTLTQIMNNIGNWSGNASSYSTTAAANLLYAPISVIGNTTTDTGVAYRIPFYSSSTNLQSSPTLNASIYGINVSGTIIANNGMYDYTWVNGAHSQTYFCDFMTPSSTTMCYPNYIGAALTGTAPKVATFTKNAFGIVNITSTTATSTGYYFMTEVNAFLIGGGENFRSQIYLPSMPASNTSRIRIGFGDSITVAAQIVDGVYWDINSTSVSIVGTPIVATNSIHTKASTNYTFNANQWYTVMVLVNATATGADFYVYDSTGVLVYNNYITATLPKVSGRTTGAGIIATVTSAGLSRSVVAVDYLSTRIDQTRRFE